MNYYGIKREVYKNNHCTPEETIIYPNLYKTIEEATKALAHDADQTALHYGYQPVLYTHQAWFDTAIQTVRNHKTGKDTIYRHEWHLIKFKMGEEQ